MEKDKKPIIDLDFTQYVSGNTVTPKFHRAVEAVKEQIEREEGRKWTKEEFDTFMYMLGVFHYIEFNDTLKHSDFD